MCTLHELNTLLFLDYQALKMSLLYTWFSMTFLLELWNFDEKLKLKSCAMCNSSLSAQHTHVCVNGITGPTSRSRRVAEFKVKHVTCN